eukprot:3661048-Rhodomonas_salina.2
MPDSAQQHAMGGPEASAMEEDKENMRMDVGNGPVPQPSSSKDQDLANGIEVYRKASDNTAPNHGVLKRNPAGPEKWIVEVKKEEDATCTLSLAEFCGLYVTRQTQHASDLSTPSTQLLDCLLPPSILNPEVPTLTLHGGQRPGGRRPTGCGSVLQDARSNPKHCRRSRRAVPKQGSRLPSLSRISYLSLPPCSCPPPVLELPSIHGGAWSGWFDFQACKPVSGSCFLARFAHAHALLSLTLISALFPCPRSPTSSPSSSSCLLLSAPPLPFRSSSSSSSARQKRALIRSKAPP